MLFTLIQRKILRPIEVVAKAVNKAIYNKTKLLHIVVIKVVEMENRKESFMIRRGIDKRK